MTEHEIASVMNRHIIERGATPVVTLVAADDRISKYRHPIPTDQKLERYAMLVTGTRRWGLVVSATRIVHFGPRSPELRCKHEAVARVDATLIAGTVPGANVGEIFRRAVDTYRLTGFAEEWKLHHQGGPTGYKGREFRATRDTDGLVVENQAFAWNPSITGTKTEDTIIARVGQGIVSAVGSSTTYKDVLRNPERISKIVLDNALDAQTAFEIVSIDIADIDVAENIGARLQADQAEADTRTARAKAESRRALAVAREQEMIARIEQSRAKVVEAEAEVPKAIAAAFREGRLGILDYYRLRNVQADTEMRQAIAGTGARNGQRVAS